MKTYDTLVSLPCHSLSTVVNVAYGKPFLKLIHGDDVEVGEWRKFRKLKLKMPSDSVPIPKDIRRFICGNEVRSTVKQKVLEDSFARHSVLNIVKPHVLGSEFIRIRSRFDFEQNQNDSPVTFRGHVEVHAIFPPPLNSILEGFMIDRARYDIEYFTSVLDKTLNSPGIKK